MISLTESGRQAYISWCNTIIRLMPGSVIAANLQTGDQIEAVEPETQNYDRGIPHEEQLIDDLFMQLP
jgi:hypothetical protein